MDNFFSTHKLYKQDNTNSLTGTFKGLPDELISLLNLVNSNSYSNGFLTFINPALYKSYIELWGINNEDCFPFIKFPFGQIIFYHNSKYKALNPVFNCIDIIGKKDELNFIMDIMLCDRVVLENSFFIDKYEQTFPSLGNASHTEMYAFIPALRLGGISDIRNIKKVSMKEEMLILSQI